MGVFMYLCSLSAQEAVWDPDEHRNDSLTDPDLLLHLLELGSVYI